MATLFLLIIFENIKIRNHNQRFTVMKKTTLFAAVLLAATQTFAQVDPVGNFNKHIVEQWTGDYVRVGQFKVKGSPYFLGEPFPGTITYSDGKSAQSQYILFDLHNQKVGFKQGNEALESIKAVESFSINLPDKFGNKKLLFKNGAAFGDASNTYYNILEEGPKFAFLKQYKIKLVADSRNTLDKDAKMFEQAYDYYIYNKSAKTLHKIKLREKDLLKELESEPAAKDYVVKNVPSLSTEHDFISVINTVNTQFK